MVHELGRRRNLPHAVMAVENLDGSFRWSGAVGHAQPDGTPMLADTPFFIASIDKLLTATVVLQLTEERKLQLDEPVTTCLPAGTMSGLHQLGGVDHTPAITVRHLLSHTSGVADFLEDRPAGGRSLLEEILEEGDRTWAQDEPLDLVRARLQPHFQPQNLTAPRVRSRYSNTNFELLNLLIEHLTGQSLAETFEHRLFKPLGLTRTRFVGNNPSSPGTPVSAALWCGKMPLDRPMALQSLRSINSTAPEMIALLRGLVNGRLFAQPGTFAQMQQRWIRFGLPFDAAALRAPSWPIEYGLGLMRFQSPRFLTPFHPVPPVIGHTGSTGSWLFYCPSLELLLAGTVDQVTAPALPYRILPRLLRACTTKA
ncbi:MAG TPA: serine hydrolase domain-containing protein [Opitutaceae bacterium]|nr:serine hydrolase domain-containing protein [Opitutaceae bacterium]